MAVDIYTLATLNGATLATPDNWVNPAVRFYKTTGWWLWKKFWYLLAEDYAIKWQSAPGVEKMVIKRAPYDFDKASVPKKAGPILGHYPYGQNEAGSLFHDDGYEKEGEDKDGRFEYYIRLEGELEWRRDHSKWSRSDLDELYRQICVWGGMSEFDARVEWLAVRTYPPNLLKKF